MLNTFYQKNRNKTIELRFSHTLAPMFRKTCEILREVPYIVSRNDDMEVWQNKRDGKSLFIKKKDLAIAQNKYADIAFSIQAYIFLTTPFKLATNNIIRIEDTYDIARHNYLPGEFLIPRGENEIIWRGKLREFHVMALLYYLSGNKFSELALRLGIYTAPRFDILFPFRQNQLLEQPPILYKFVHIIPQDATPCIIYARSNMQTTYDPSGISSIESTKLPNETVALCFRAKSLIFVDLLIYNGDNLREMSQAARLSKIIKLNLPHNASRDNKNYLPNTDYYFDNFRVYRATWYRDLFVFTLMDEKIGLYVLCQNRNLKRFGLTPLYYDAARGESLVPIKVIYDAKEAVADMFRGINKKIYRFDINFNPIAEISRLMIPDSYESINETSV